MESSTGAEWMRRPRGLSTVRVVPTSCGVGLGVTIVTAVGVLDGGGVRDGVDGTPAQPETITSAPTAAANAKTGVHGGFPRVSGGEHVQASRHRGGDCSKVVTAFEEP